MSMNDELRDLDVKIAKLVVAINKLKTERDALVGRLKVVSDVINNKRKSENIIKESE